MGMFLVVKSQVEEKFSEI